MSCGYLQSHRTGEPVNTLHPVVSANDIVELQTEVRNVEVESSVARYLLDLADASRASDDLRIGVSTRGALSLYRAAQAMAFVENRAYVVPDDVKRLAVPVLSHRVMPVDHVQDDSRAVMEQIIGRIVAQVPVPT